MKFVKDNARYLYAIAAAGLAIAAHYYPDLPVKAVLGAVSAALGV
jgi:hypothetical protein